MNIIATITLIASYITLSQAVLHRHPPKDPYENIENCPGGKSGPNCDIPYQTCLDNKRKCFHNSQCKLIDMTNPLSEYMYECDCSFSKTISPVAGAECEHPATVICSKDNFCTNGGKCGDYILKQHAYSGCHCLEDFAGAHCQYLKATMTGSLEGEANVPEIGHDFYVNTGKIKPLYALGSMTIIALVAFSVASVVYVIIHHRQRTMIKSLNLQLKQRSQEVSDISTSKGEIA